MQICLSAIQLRKIRQKHKLTIESAASLIGVTSKQWGKYERPDIITNIPSERAYRLFKQLDTNIPINGFSSTPTIGFVSLNGGVGVTAIVEDLAASYITSGYKPIIYGAYKDGSGLDHVYENGKEFTKSLLSEHKEGLGCSSHDVELYDFGNNHSAWFECDLMVAVLSLDRFREAFYLERFYERISDACPMRGLSNTRLLISNDESICYSDVSMFITEYLEDTEEVEQTFIDLFNDIEERHTARIELLDRSPVKKLPCVLGKSYESNNLATITNPKINSRRDRILRATNQGEQYGIAISLLRKAIEDELYIINDLNNIDETLMN
jgi:hypothetical protein